MEFLQQSNLANLLEYIKLNHKIKNIFGPKI